MPAMGVKDCSAAKLQKVALLYHLSSSLKEANHKKAPPHLNGATGLPNLKLKYDEDLFLVFCVEPWFLRTVGASLGLHGLLAPLRVE